MALVNMLGIAGLFLLFCHLTLKQSHSASLQVWDCKALQRFLVSCGEDNRCIVWTYAGERLVTFEGHRGRGIRSLACRWPSFVALHLKPTNLLFFPIVKPGSQIWNEN